MSNNRVRTELLESAGVARAWLFDRALPLWWERGFDRQTGCFAEGLAPDGSPARLPLRVRVQARQTIAYAIAGRLGWSGPWREAVAAGAEVLTRRCLRGDGGARHLLTPNGAPLDDRRDLYDLAFVIYAFAEAGRALSKPDLIAAAVRQADWIETNWADPAGGYTQGEVSPAPPRRQNPHMHAFEALLALYEATGDGAHLRRASALAALFRNKMFAAQRGALIEYFDADWRPMADTFGLVVEPGHVFEWSWLLLRWQALGGGELGAEAEQLRNFGERFGVDERGVVRDQILIDGTVRKASSRLWTNTERLKANLARFERTGDVAAAQAALHAFSAIMAYRDGVTPGLWRDQRLADGDYADEPTPASILYHIVLAFAELIRVAEADQDTRS